jgi:NADH-quinone oxidoreductase subunit F
MMAKARAIKPPLRNKTQLGNYARQARKRRDRKSQVIFLCAGTGCRASGAIPLAEAMREEIAEKGLGRKVELKLTGCHGFCEQGPLIVHHPSGVFYRTLKPKHVADVLETTVEKGDVVEKLLYETPSTGEPVHLEQDIPFYKHQKRLVFDLNGRIDPFSIDDYIAENGYRALANALSMDPGEIIDEVERASLRGRGGAGFPTGTKWRIARSHAGDGAPVHLVCNADEGDPGAFMDRSIIEGNPHRVIEGMVIGALALGASRGYVYIRNEYPLALRTLRAAIEDARAFGLLGQDILSSGHDFDIHIHRGAGAFVCGEETGLILSLQGMRGQPRSRPPFPAESGLHGEPTLINNVETWANVPLIMDRGADWFTSTGTDTSKGSKIFSLVGKVANTGLVEVPMGLTLRSLVYDIGGGIPDGRELKAVQTGGPSGGAIPASMIDLPIDFEALTNAGSMMGSGGMIVMDDRNCMVDIAKYFLEFLIEESCGKCVPCREGLRRARSILERICEGEGRMEDLDRLESLGRTIMDASLCGLGKTAANPLLSTLHHFRDEYEAHILQQRCPGATCRALITYTINDECNGCHLCFKACPHDAISGEKKKMHVIDQDACDRCGACLQVCKYDAIDVE